MGGGFIQYQTDVPPQGWSRRQLSDALSKVIDYRGKAPPKSVSGVRLITARNVRFGSLDLNHAEYIDREKYDAWMNRGKPCGSDVLFTTEAPLGNACMFPAEGTFAVGQRLITLRPNPDLLDSRFLLNFLLSDLGQELIRKRSSGSCATGIKSKEFAKLTILLPPVSEQKRIGEILSTWDCAIENVEALIANARTQNDALMQSLLTGKRRLPGFVGSWIHSTISDISIRVSRRNDGTELPVLTISSTAGFVRQDEKYRRYMAGKSVENYIMLRRGEFAYNKGNSKSYEFGCVFDLEDFECGLVPHVYVCFKLKPGYSHRFYKALFEADYLAPQLARLVNTGVRNNGLLNITPAQFLGTSVPVPPIDEQDAIAAVMETASAKVRVLEGQLAALREEKSALMQQLLTGKRRVNEDQLEAAA